MLLLQQMLAAVHLQGKEGEDERISRLLAEKKKVFPFGIAPARVPARFVFLEQARLLITSYSLFPGSPLAAMLDLEARIRDLSIPTASKSNVNALAAINWYWTQLRWPTNPA